jgi:DNA-binding MarR family transcriptional regulator
MDSVIAPEAGTAKAGREVWRRWTPRLVAGGWTPVADCFLEHYRRLGLTTLEAMLILQLMKYKWDENAPRPSFATLAQRMGITDTAVRGHARQIAKKGLLRRINRIGRPNLFDLTPLFDALEKLLDEDEVSRSRINQAATQVEAEIAATPN